MTSNNDDFSDEPDKGLIFIIIGEVKREKDGEMIPFNALMAAPDDDTAVRVVLETFAAEGYIETDLHQIGNLDGEPEEEEFLEAYKAALSGEVALIFFEGGYDFSGNA